MRRLTLTATIVALAASPAALLADDPAAPAAPARPTFDAEGNVAVPAFTLPPSELLSPEALAAQKMRAKMRMPATGADIPVDMMRKGLTMMLAGQVAALQKDYPVDIEETTIGGVPVRVFTPKGKPWDKKRVLVNLHGGGFSMCWESCSMLESIPIAVTGGYKVVSVNYRMGPEARHPAALEDVEAVYRQLLKAYPAKSIGIYGCSAGGSLSAQMGAWLPSRGLPQPGALGMFGGAGVRFLAGDSGTVAAYIDGSFAPPPKPGEKFVDMTRGYFTGAEIKGPIISPALHPATIAKFPPSLLITGTRAMDLTPVVYTNTQLLKAGVKSTLVVGEGMGHCYIYQSALPEARDTWGVIVRFFRDNLK